MEGNSENMEEYKEANKIELYFLLYSPNRYRIPSQRQSDLQKTIQIIRQDPHQHGQEGPYDLRYRWRSNL